MMFVITIVTLLLAFVAGRMSLKVTGLRYIGRRARQLEMSSRLDDHTNAHNLARLDELQRLHREVL